MPPHAPSGPDEGSKNRRTQIIAALITAAVPVVLGFYFAGRGAKVDAALSSGSVAASAPASPSAGSPPARLPRVDSLGRNILAETSAVQVFRTLQDVPDLQKQDVARATYLGRWMEVRGEVLGLSAGEDGIWASLGEDGIFGSAFEVRLPLSSRSALLNVRRGDTLHVLGRIDRVPYMFVELLDAELIRP
jgi:hypothetical protein